MMLSLISAEKTAGRLEGDWINRPDSLSGLAWINARSDSRTIREREVFVALSGSRTDGHDHLEEARLKGALFAVVQRPVTGSPLPQLLVRDTVLALRDMAALALAAHRSAGHRLVALTGSVGKTTTRELLRRGLMPEGGVCSSRGNENNEIGVPLTLLSWPGDYRYCVLEVGVRKPGDMDYLAPLLDSDVGIVTAIEPGHLENLGTVEAVWAEKSKLLKAVLPGGSLVLPGQVRRRFASDPLLGYPGRRIVAGSIGEGDEAPGTLVATLRVGTGMTLHVEEWDLDLPLSRPSAAPGPGVP
ncbi:MAG: UDP-N-acetylmuramoyl-tripeptide-D-alanyl-D-alanine ligase, partial [Leptospirillum sp. Group IV 'UBA BS']